MGYRQDDINLLLPSVRVKVGYLLGRMEKEGFKPVLRDSWRSPEEASALKARGTGIEDSIHCYRAAADIICYYHGWTCGKKVGCNFFERLGANAEDLGFVWGGRWKRRPDRPHVQAVTIPLQNTFRALGMEPESEGARDAMCAAHFKKWQRSEK